MIPCCMSLFYSYHANCIIGISHTEIPLYSLCKERWREGGRREREKERGKGRERERERERGGWGMGKCIPLIALEGSFY